MTTYLMRIDFKDEDVQSTIRRFIDGVEFILPLNKKTNIPICWKLYDKSKCMYITTNKINKINQFCKANDVLMYDVQKHIGDLHPTINKHMLSWRVSCPTKIEIEENTPTGLISKSDRIKILEDMNKYTNNSIREKLANLSEWKTSDIVSVIDFYSSINVIPHEWMIKKYLYDMSSVQQKQYYIPFKYPG